MQSFIQDLPSIITVSLLFLMVAVWLAKTVETVTGFGGSVISVALGALFYPVEIIVPAVVSLNLISTLYLVLRHGRTIDRKVLCVRILPFMGIGLLVGMAVFNFGPGNVLKIGLGIFVIFIAIFETIRFIKVSDEEGSARKPLKSWQAAICLIFGGVVHGIYASGGPLAVYFATRQFNDKKVFRSTLSMLWLILTVILLGNYLFTGKVTSETLSISFMLLPALLLGIFMGEYIHNKINERAFRLFVYILLLMAGISLIL